MEFDSTPSSRLLRSASSGIAGNRVTSDGMSAFSSACAWLMVAPCRNRPMTSRYRELIVFPRTASAAGYQMLTSRDGKTKERGSTPMTIRAPWSMLSRPIAIGHKG